MSALRTRFGELRSLIAARPSAQRWEALMGWLEPLEDDEALLDHLPYIQAALASWPDALRAATAAQLERLERGAPPGPLWPLIRALSISGHSLQQHQIASILAHEATAALPTVLLANAPQPDETWIEHLATRAALRQLKLDFHTIHPAQLGPLLEAARWERLESLAIDWTQDALAQAALALAHTAALAHLRTLSLAWSRLGPHSVDALQRAQLPALRHLHLDCCRLDDHGAARLLRALKTPSLESLDLSNNTLGDETIAALCEPLTLPTLRTLGLSGAGLSDAQLSALLTSPRAASLHKLDMRYNNMVTRHAALRLLAPQSVELALER